jgi:hypothetical protein
VRRLALGGAGWLLAIAAVGAWLHNFRPWLTVGDPEAAQIVSAIVPAYFLGLSLARWGSATPWASWMVFWKPSTEAQAYVGDVFSSVAAIVATVLAWLLIHEGLSPFRGGSTETRWQYALAGCAMLTVVALLWAGRDPGPRPSRSLALRTAIWLTLYAYAYVRVFRWYGDFQ